MKPAGTLMGLLATLVVGAAHGKQCKGVEFPEHLRVDNADLTLNGVGMRTATFLKINVYIAGLYVTAPSRDPNVLIAADTPQEVILHFVRSVGVDDVRKAWTIGFQKIVQEQSAAFSQKVATLNSWMSDMKSGQRLIFIRKPREGVQVSVNGTNKGTIPGDDFSLAFMSIWVGERPTNSELKVSLLGGECN